MSAADRHDAVLTALNEAQDDAQEAAIAADGWTWSDGEPFPDGTADVFDEEGREVIYASGLLMAATARHIAAYSPRLVLEQLAARRRIVERHPPVNHEPSGTVWCARCLDPALGKTYEPFDWSCADYRDAAADLLPDASG